MIGTQIAIPDCVLSVPGLIIGTPGAGGGPPPPPEPAFGDNWQVLVGDGGPQIIVWQR